MRLYKRNHWDFRRRARKTLGFLIVAASLLYAGPLFAQQSVVAQVKADLVARGLDISGECGAFRIVLRVAWTLRGQGAGLVAKPGGSNCQGYSTDLIQFSDRWVDILGDAGGMNAPAWAEHADVTPSMWRAPFDPGDTPAPAPIPQPTPQPIPAPPIDWSGVYQVIRSEVQRVYDQNERIYDAENQARAQQTTQLVGQIMTVEQRVEQHDEKVSPLIAFFGNRYAQLALTALGTILTTQQVTK
jgi:hypothetical protein